MPLHRRSENELINLLLCYILIIVATESSYICIIVCLLSPDDVLYVELELISKIKYAVCKLDDEPLGERDFSFHRSALFFVLGFFVFCLLFLQWKPDLLIPLSFQVLQTASLNSEAIRP